MSWRPSVARYHRVFLATTALSGCIDSPQSEVAYAAVAINDGRATTTVGQWSVELTRAEWAFGPVYFCAGASASSTLCSSSIAEIASVARVDGLALTPMALGDVHGFTGTILSASYDYGISWFDTAYAPTAAPLAPLGHSMRIEGEARRGAERIAIVANVDVVPQLQGQRAVPTTKVAAEVSSDATILEVHFDVSAWIRQLDFDAMAAAGRAPFTIEPGTPEHNALLLGINNLAPPAFRWVSTGQQSPMKE